MFKSPAGSVFVVIDSGIVWTVRVVLPVIVLSLTFAEIVAVPFARAEANPVLLTVATLVFEEDQVS